jgi:hypothetical protein
MILPLLAAAQLALTGCATLPPPAPPAVDSARLLRMGTVQVDADARMVVVTGFVNQVEDAIELLACGPGGKTHESIFVMQAHAMDLQTALLLLDLKPGPPHEELGQGPPNGPRVDVWVTWTDETGARHAHPAELFAYNIETGRVLPHTGWAFTGSVILDGQFKALAEESYLATFWDPWAILNILNNEVGPDDELLAVNRALVPPLNTPVTFVLVPYAAARK